MPLHIIILAAGLGTRMHSKTPKVLHQIGGKPMLTHVVETALKLNPECIHVVVGHGSALVQKTLASFPLHWVIQETQLGTGHAVLQAMPHIPHDADVLILSADVPLIQSATLERLLAQRAPLKLLVAVVDTPFGLGRIKRNTEGAVIGIVEEKDASPIERDIKEIYSGICSAKAAALHRWLPQLTPQNAQKELYLTDIVTMAVQEKTPIEGLRTQHPMEIQGVNNRLQLQILERSYQEQQAHAYMLAGITIADGARVEFRGELEHGQDVLIDVNTIFEGKVVLGNNVHIGAHCILSNVTIGDNAHILPYSILDNATIGEHCTIGPFARIRPNTVVGAHGKIGNFVEVKNTTLGAHSKASHLSYLGDATIGQDVNIGAGTITCNYDGINKHQTIIEDGAFIGSDTQLVAPVVVGKNATLGAGTTLRKNAPANTLTLSPTIQKTLEGWARPIKNKV